MKSITKLLFIVVVLMSVRMVSAENWSAPIYCPEYGDRILQVNDTWIESYGDFWDAVKSSPRVMYFLLRDTRSGEVWHMRAELNPPDAYTRFGVYVKEDSGPGVKVTGVMGGTPGTRCRKGAEVIIN